MPQETLYRPKGAGHDAPGERKDYIRPRDELFEAFTGWMEHITGSRMASDFLYDSAMEMMPDLTGATSEKINSVVIPFGDHPDISYAGSFLSAAYNKSGLATILADVPLEGGVNNLGYRLAEGKRLVIKCGIGHGCGQYSAGTILNYGDMPDDTAPLMFGDMSSGTMVNYGRITDSFGEDSTGILVNFGKVHSLGPDGAEKGLKSPEVTVNFGNVVNVGWGPSGIVVNKGAVSNVLGWKSSGILIAAEKPKLLGRAYSKWASLFLGEEDCRSVPGLLDFIGALEDGLGPHKHYTEVLAHLEGLDVESDIRRILTEAGRLEA